MSLAHRPSENVFQTRLYLFHRDDRFIRSLYRGDFYPVLLGQCPSIFRSFILGRPFGRQHFVFQSQVDIANMPSHFCVRFFRAVEGGRVSIQSGVTTKVMAGAFAPLISMTNGAAVSSNFRLLAMLSHPVA